MDDQMHLAAQYLAAAGISFLEKKDDDSHTNFGFSITDKCLYTHSLSINDDVLGLDYDNFALVWKSKKGKTSFSLDGVSHSTILKWLSDMSKSNLNKLYTYKFHYTLPYSIDASYTFKLSNLDRLKTLTAQRVMVEKVIESIKADYKLEAPCRVWPHHFDTGIYAKIPDTNLTIGLGLAIPDNVSKTHYFYISGYKNDKIIKPYNFFELTIGEWRTEDFTGAILELLDVNKNDTISFFKEAIKQFKSK